MGSAGLEAKFGSARAGDGDIPYISRQGQPLEVCRPPPAWQCTLTAGGVSRGGVRGAASSSAVRAAPVRALLPRGHRIPHMACTPCWQPVVKKRVERSMYPCPP